GDEETVSAYVVAASSGDAVYLIESSTLESGQISTEEGWEEASGTAYLYPYNKYLYRLVYAQGNAGLCSSYYLDANGEVQQRDRTYEVTSRFTTYGIYGDYLIMAASGATTSLDANGNPQYGVTFSYIDMEKETLSTKTVVTENMTGNGEYYTVSGILQRDGKFFTALCPQGYSHSAIVRGLVPDEYEDLIVYNESTETYSISTTVHPNTCWIAIYSGIGFENPTIIEDDRLQYATSRMQSQFYSTIDMDDQGNIYVFSSSNSVSNTDSRQVTEKKSGVIRIPTNSEAFDDYYVDIEARSGGCRLFNVWHITEDYFLLRMFDTPEDKSSSSSSVTTRRLAIFQAGSETFTWVTGIPEYTSIGSFGNFPTFENGKAYMPTVTTDGALPAVYVIDPVTATATKGLSVDRSTSISAVGRLDYQ
ncbi:MAG: DUF4374 domain-containing protein, partial [Rikenellaceae bacterium]|nr:DUF4374 domain-containing protein [Rikenellaceae bacterium]